MKKQSLLILTAALAVFQFTSCNSDDRNPEITQFNAVSESQITIGHEAGTHIIEYEIVNPVPDGSVSVEVSPDAEWITDVNSTAAYGKVNFTVTENIDTVSVREAVITLIYEGQELEFTVTQEHAQVYSSFALDVMEDECTTGMIVWKVTPPDDELTYVSMIVDRATWDSFGTYEEYMEYDMEYFNELAAESNLSCKEYLEKYVLKKGVQTVSTGGLNPDSDYVVYAYGMNSEGRVLTGMYYAEARTLPIEEKDVTFELTVSQEFPFATISAVPSDNEVRYMIELYNGAGTPEVIAEAYSEMIQELIYLAGEMGGMSTYDFLMASSYQGPATAADPFMLSDAMVYTAFAVAIDVYTGALTSSVSVKVFEIEF